MSDPQEPHFFSHDENWERGLPFYESLFPTPAEGFQAIGEGTVYSESTEVNLPRIRSVFSPDDLKLIYIARHPLERLESAYRHNHLALGKKLEPFSELIKKQRWFPRSRHFEVCETWREAFGKDNLHAVLFDDLRQDPVAVARSCFKFLGLNADVPLVFANRAYNHSGERAAKQRLAALQTNHLLKKIVPPWLRPKLSSFAINLLKKRVEDPVKWTPESLDYACEMLEPDAKRFLASLRRDPEMWSFPHRETHVLLR